MNLSDQELETAGDLLTEFLRSFERSLDNRRVTLVLDRNQLSKLFAAPFPDVGIGVESLFRDIQEKVLPNCTTVAHRRFLAYVLGPPNGIAPYAEAVAAAMSCCYVPLPERVTVGDAPPPSLTLSVALRAPVAAGVKVTVMTQLARAASIAGATGQLST